MKEAKTDVLAASKLQSRSETHRSQGNQLFAQHKYAEAASQYTQAINLLLKNENSAPSEKVTILNNRALAYFRSGAYQESLNDALEALKLDVTSTKALHRASLTYLMLGLPSEAVSHLITLSNSDRSGTAVDAGAATTSALLQRAMAVSKHQLQIILLQKGMQPKEEEIEVLIQLKNHLDDLWGDAGGDEDADIPSCLSAITQALETSKTARAWFELHKGYQITFYFFTGEHCEGIAAVLRAAAASHVLWPVDIWQRLLTAATSNNSEIATTATRLILWAANKSPEWVQMQLLVHPLPVSGAEAQSADGRDSLPGAVPILRSIIQAMHPHAKGGDGGGGTKLPLEALKFAAELLMLYGKDVAGVTALRTMGLTPLQMLVAAIAAAPETVAASNHSNNGASCGSIELDQEIESNKALPESEQEALEVLREKQRAVFDKEAVELRRLLLTVLRVLCSHRDMILDEALICSHKGTTKVTEGPLVASLLGLLRKFEASSPKRTAPMLGPDGQPTAYDKRPFAADWQDNPTGDFLTHLDLDGSSDQAARHLPPSTPPLLSSLKRKQQSSSTQLELALDCLLLLCKSSAAVATACFKHGVLSICSNLCIFLTDSVVATAQEIAGEVCHRCPAALEEALAKRYNLPILTGIAKVAVLGGQISGDGKAQQHALRAMDEIAGKIDFCSGDEFAALTETTGVLKAAFKASQENSHPSKLAAASVKVLRLCAKRAWKCHQGGSSLSGSSPRRLPRGQGWETIENKERLLEIISPVLLDKTAKQTVDVRDDKEGMPRRDSMLTNGGDVPAAASYSSAKGRSFLSTNTTAPSRKLPSERPVKYGNGVVIEDITD